MKKVRRKSAKRQASRKMPFSVRFGILVTVLVMIVVAAGVLMAPGFRVSEVYCEGNTNVKSEDIFASANVESGKNIFLIGIGKAERNVDKLPMIKEVNIKRIFPNKICITVEERLPLAYVKTGVECAAVDEELIVVEKEEQGASGKLIENNTPAFDKLAEKEEKDSTQTKNENQVNEEESQQTEEASENIFFSIPLIEGLELKEAEENKKARCDDEEKLNNVIKICVALKEAGLLNRTTYINVTDMQNVSVVIENRLDVRLGNVNNIEYRAKFLAEVINNKISAYETLILDYTGDDIYARAHDDGKDRTKIEEKKESEESEEAENIEGTEEEEAEEDNSQDEESEEESGEEEGNDNNGVTSL